MIPGPREQVDAVTRDVDAGEGLRLHVVSSGRGPALVLLHGFTGSAATWTFLHDALGNRFTLHAVDLPGHGRSSAPADHARYALTRFADDLARVLDVLAVDRTAVLGYSLGGRAALRFALAYPTRVSALVLESASPGIADPAEHAERRQSDEAMATSIEREGVPAFVERWERLPLWDSQRALPEATREALRAQRLANQARGLANSLRGAGSAAEPAVEQLASLDVPTLLVAGALDAKYVGIGQRMAQAMPRAKMSVVEAAGHAVHLEQPGRFATVVAEFLASLQ